MSLPATILVPLDGTRRAAGALPVAGALATLAGATVSRLYVGEDPAGAIVQASDAAASPLIVMSMLDSPLGRATKAVLRKATCPIVVVPPREKRQEWQLRRVLLPLDGSPAAAAGLRPASELCTRGGASLYVVHIVVPEPAQPREAGTLAAPAYIDRPEYDWPAWTDEFLARNCACGVCYACADTRLHLRCGEPGVEIVRFAAEHAIDLIVVAWRGDFEGERARTLKMLLDRAVAPVMVLRTHDARPLSESTSLDLLATS